MGIILGLTLIAVLLFFAARYLYIRIWLPRSDKHHKCIHCGRYYEGNPYYCPHCGEVLGKKDKSRNN